MPKVVPASVLIGLVWRAGEDRVVDRSPQSRLGLEKALGISRATATRYLDRLDYLLNSADAEERITDELFAALRRERPRKADREDFASRFRTEPQKKARQTRAEPDYPRIYELELRHRRSGTPVSAYALYRDSLKDNQVKPLGASRFYERYAAWRGDLPKADQVADCVMSVWYSPLPMRISGISCRLFVAHMSGSGWLYAEIAYGEDHVRPPKSAKTPGEPTRRHWVTAHQRALESLGRVPRRIEPLRSKCAAVINLSLKAGSDRAFPDRETYKDWAVGCGAIIDEIRVPRGPLPKKPPHLVEVENKLHAVVGDQSSLSLQKASEAIKNFTEVANSRKSAVGLSPSELVNMILSDRDLTPPYNYMEKSLASVTRIDRHIINGKMYLSFDESKLPPNYKSYDDKIKFVLYKRNGSVQIYFDKYLVADHKKEGEDFSRVSGTKTVSTDRHGEHLFITDPAHVSDARWRIEKINWLVKRTNVICEGLGDKARNVIESDNKPYVWFRMWYATLKKIEGLTNSRLLKDPNGLKSKNFIDMQSFILALEGILPDKKRR